MMRQSEIAIKVNVTRQTIHNIFKGRRRPSPELAKKLEQVTGVPRLCWLYPDEFPNPYIKDSTTKKQNKQKSSRRNRHVD